MVREGLLRHAGRVGDGHRQRDHQGLPQAGAGICTPTRTPATSCRRAVQRGQCCVRRARRRGQARRVRRGPPLGPMAGSGWHGQVGPARGASRSMPTTSATWAVVSATSSATCSVAGRRRGGGAPGGAGPRRGADVEAHLTVDFEDAGEGHDHHAAPHHRRAVLHLWWLRCRSRHLTGRLWQLWRPGSHRRQPGPLRLLRPVSGLSGPGRADRVAVRHVSGHRHREAPAGGQDPDPRRSERRPDHPPEGAWCSRTKRWPERRSARPAHRDATRAPSAARATTSRSTVPVSFAEAALGADIEVPALDGGTVTLRIKPGSQSGSAAPRARNKVSLATYGEGPGDRQSDRHRRRGGAGPNSPTHSVRPQSRRLAAKRVR